MGLISNMKNKIKEEVDSYKNRRQMERDPKVLKALIKDRQEQQKRELDYAKDRETLQRLKNSTGARGAIVSALGSVKSHLATVKARNEKQGKKLKLRDPNQSAFNTIGGSSGGVLNTGMNGKGMHSGSSGTSLLLQGSKSKGGVLSDNKKKGKGVFG